MHVHDMGETYFITRITWQVGGKSIACFYKWHVCGLKYMRIEVMVFNVTFNNISWRSVFFVEKTGENHGPAARHWQTLSHNVVSSTPHLSGVWHHNFSTTIRSRRPLKSIINFWKFLLDAIATINKLVFYEIQICNYWKTICYAIGTMLLGQWYGQGNII
jgi:hypothetical protein